MVNVENLKFSDKFINEEVYCVCKTELEMETIIAMYIAYGNYNKWDDSNLKDAVDDELNCFKIEKDNSLVYGSIYSWKEEKAITFNETILNEEEIW